MRTFKPALTFRLLIAIFLLLPAAGLLVAAVFQPDVRTVMLSIGLPLMTLSAWLWVLAGRPELTVDDKGVTRRGAFGGVVTMRWDEVTEYFYRTQTVRGAEIVNLRLLATDGRKLAISSNWRDVYEAAQLLIEGVETVLRAPAFGALTIEADALVYKNKRVPFDEIDGVTFNGAAVRVGRKGKFLAAFNADTGKLPNVFLLLDELRARGLNAPDARPWNAVVSLAGYQLPKK